MDSKNDRIENKLNTVSLDRKENTEDIPISEPDAFDPYMPEGADAEPDEFAEAPQSEICEVLS